MSRNLHAGVFVVEITPPPGLDLAGFAIREQGAIGALDPLYAKALVLKDGDQRAALLTVDLLGIANTDVEYIREGVCQKTGIPAGNIMIAASHTHSGPATLPTNGIGKINPRWIGVLRKKLIQCVVLANEQLVPVSIYFSRGSVDIGINRRGKIPEGSIHPMPDPTGIIDRELSVLQLMDESQNHLMAVLFNCACHPVVLGEDNRYYSADFPGAATEYVKKSIGENTVVMFTNGACGDINPLEVGTYEIAKKLGKRVAESVLKTLSIKEHPLQATLNIHQHPAVLPFASIPGIEEARQQVLKYKNAYKNAGNNAEKIIAHACLAWAKQIHNACKRNTIPTALNVEIQKISIGEVSLIAIPAEVFSETGLYIKKKASNPTIIIGYGNGNVGYVPPEGEISKGGYEVLEAHKYYNNPNHFAAQAEKNIRETALKLLSLNQ